MHVAIVPAEHAHIAPIVDRVRPADAAELWAIGRATPQQCLKQGLRLSGSAFTGLVDDAPVAMFGVTPYSILGGIGTPWMVGTTALDRRAVQRHLVRLSRPTLAHLAALFPVLVNVVDDRNTAAHRWLRWLGFTLGEPEPFGPDRLPFRAFCLETP